VDQHKRQDLRVHDVVVLVWIDIGGHARDLSCFDARAAGQGGLCAL
jgi:hypothetical protein